MMKQRKIDPHSTSSKTANIEWTPHCIRVLAVKACTDPRTAASWVAGKSVSSTCAARLEAALEELCLSKIITTERR